MYMSDQDRKRKEAFDQAAGEILGDSYKPYTPRQVDQQTPQPVQQQTPIQRLLNDPIPQNDQKWYKGDTPTATEVGARIYTISQADPEKGHALYTQFQQFQNTPGSPYYNPYANATNKAIKALSDLGFDMRGGITKEWLEQNAWLKNYYRMETGNTPLAPSSKSTKEQDAAYWYYQALKAEETTEKAENELAALNKELQYWAGRTDRNMNDDEILAKVDWTKYPTLASMDKARGEGRPTPLNRAIGYNSDYLSGMLWAARGNESTGSAYQDSIKALLGQGNSWQENKDVRDKLNPDSPNYSPYSAGSTIDEAALYFDVAAFGPTWVQENGNRILMGNDATAKRQLDAVIKAEKNTLKAEQELKELNAEIEDWLKYNKVDADTILKDILDPYPTLKKMAASMRGEDELVDTTRAIDFDMKKIAADVRRRVEEKRNAPGGDDFDADLAGKMDYPMPSVSENDAAVNAARNEAIAAAADTIRDAGTDEEKIVFQTAYEYGFDERVAKISEAITGGQLSPEAATEYSFGHANNFAKDNYIWARKEMKPYEDTQAEIEETTKERDQLRRILDQERALQKWEDEAEYRTPWAPTKAITPDGYYYYDVSASFDPETGKFSVSKPSRIDVLETDEELHNRLYSALNNYHGEPESDYFDKNIWSVVDMMARKAGLPEDSAGPIADMVWDKWLSSLYDEDWEGDTNGIINLVQEAIDETADGILEGWDAEAAQAAADEWAATLPDFSAYAAPGKKVESLTADELEQVTTGISIRNEKLKELNTKLESQKAAYEKGKERLGEVEKEYAVAEEIARLSGKEGTVTRDLPDLLDFIFKAGAEYVPTNQDVYTLYEVAEQDGYDYETIAKYAAEGQKKYEKSVQDINYALALADKLGVEIEPEFRRNMEGLRDSYQRQMYAADWYMTPKREDFAEVVAGIVKDISREDTNRRNGGTLANTFLGDEQYTSDEREKAVRAAIGEGLFEDKKNDEIYLYLLKTQGPEAAREFELHTREIEGAEFRQAVEENFRNLSSDPVGGVFANILAAIATPFELIPSLAVGLSALTGTNLSRNDPVFTVTNARNAVRNTSREAIDEATSGNGVLNFLAKAGYDVFTSVADNAVNMMVFNGLGLSDAWVGAAGEHGTQLFLRKMLQSAIQAAPMSLEVAGSTYQNALDSGASPEQAFAMAGASVFSEWISETIEVENIHESFGRAGLEGAKRSIKEHLVGALSEAIGEGASELIEKSLDQVIKSNIYGPDPEEWNWAEVASDVGYAALLGAVSSGVYSIAGAAGNAYREARLNTLEEQNIALQNRQRDHTAVDAGQVLETSEDLVEKRARKKAMAKLTQAFDRTKSIDEIISELENPFQRPVAGIEFNAEDAEAWRANQQMETDRKNGTEKAGERSQQKLLQEQKARDEAAKAQAEAEELERQARELQQMRDEVLAGGRSEAAAKRNQNRLLTQDAVKQSQQQVEQEALDTQREAERKKAIPKAGEKAQQSLLARDAEITANKESVEARAEAERQAVVDQHAQDKKNSANEQYLDDIAQKISLNEANFDQQELDAKVEEWLKAAEEKRAYAAEQERKAQHAAEKRANAEKAAADAQTKGETLEAQENAQAEADADVQKMLDDAAKRKAEAEEWERLAKEEQDKARKAAKGNDLEERQRKLAEDKETLQREAERRQTEDNRVQQMLEEAARNKAEAEELERAAKELQKHEHQRQKEQAQRDNAEAQQQTNETLAGEAENQQGMDQRVQKMLDDAARRKAEAEEQERAAKKLQKEAQKAAKKNDLDAKQKDIDERDAALQQEAQRQAVTDTEVQGYLEEAEKARAEAEAMEQQARELAQQRKAEKAEALEAEQEQERQEKLELAYAAKEWLDALGLDSRKPLQDLDLSGDREITVKQASALTDAMSANGATQTAALAAVLNSGATDKKTARMFGTAAQHAAAKFGGRKAVGALRGVLLDGLRHGIDNDTLRVAYMVGTLGNGKASDVLDTIVYGGSENGDAQALIEAAAEDMNNSEVLDAINETVQNNREANVVRDLVGDKALENVDKAKQKLADEKARLRENRANLKKQQDLLASMVTQQEDLVGQLMENPGDTSIKDDISNGLKEIKGQRNAVAAAENDVRTAEESVTKAQEELDKESSDALNAARAQAQQAVSDQMMAEQQEEAALAEQAKAEEQARAEAEAARQDVNNIASMNADDFIRKVLGENASSKDKRQVRELFKKVQQEFTPDAVARRGTFVRQVAQKFGVNIQFGDGGEGLQAGRGNGYYDPDTNTIVLDPDATVGDAMYAVLGHELTHVAEQSGTYEELATALLQLRYGKDVGDYRNFLNSIQDGSNRGRAAMDVLGTQSLYSGRLGRDVSVEYAAQEIIADIMGKDVLKGNKEFIDRLAAEHRNVAQRILDSIKSFLRKLGGAEGQWKNDAQKIVDMLETALKEHAQNTQVTSSENVVDDGNRDANAARPLVKNSAGDTLVDSLPGETVAKHSLSSWTPKEIAKVTKNLLKNGFTSEQINQWIRDVNSVAAVIAADKDRLDFIPDPDQKFKKPNGDVYKWTLDASTLCAKRLLYQGTFNAIQKMLPNTPLRPGDLIVLANMMHEMGYQTPCGICYVESRRRHLGNYTEEFLENYKGEYKPTYAELTSTEGLAKLKETHPQAYKDYIDAMNGKGVASQKVVQLRTDYRGDVRNLNKNSIDYLISIGGLRIQSFSDFETPHLMDMMQAVIDMAAVHLTSQAYTKVPNFAWVFGDTGIKINLSLMGEGTGVDADGNLIFSNTEGMDFDEAMRLRDRYSKNVGTVLVGMNDAHIIAAMGDNRIDYIIPFHRSGWSNEELRLMQTLANYTDYQDTQNEMWIIGRDKDGGYKTKSIEKNVGNLEPYGENGYWDYKKTGRENAERYLQLCAEQKRMPKFSQFLVDNGDGSFSLPQGNDTRSTNIREGYWKTLIDFKMYDNDGVGAPQQAVTPNINMGEAMRVLNEYKPPEGGNNSLPVAQPVVDRYVEEYKRNHPGRKYSLPAVAPVQSSDENVWQPGHSEEWFRENGFPIYQDVPLDQQEINRNTSKKGHGTQIASTESTYRKLFDRIKEENPGTWQDMRVLDASSGLGLGTQAGRNMGFQVTDIEPFPNDTYAPDYTDYEELLRQVRTGETEPFDFIISNAVLNVIPQDTRDNLVVAMGNLLKPGGSMFVNVISKDYEGARNSNPDLNASLASRKGSARTMEGDYSRSGNANGRGHETFVWGSNSVQKVFSVPELIGYLKDALGDGYSFKRDNLGMTGVLVTKDANHQGEGRRYSLPGEEYDQEYQEALDAGDTDWQAMLVDKAAYDAGYVTGAYHGSPMEDITEFNTRSQEEKRQRMQLLFGTHFTQNRSYADLYARKAKNSKGTSRMTSKYGRVYNAKLDLGNSLDLQTARNHPEGSEMYSLYNDLPENIKRKVPARTFSEYDTREGLGSGKYVTASIIEQALQAMSPKDATDFLVSHGYNSVKYLADYSTGMANNRMTRDASVIMLDPERIKSADPVTYDEQGNVIPLSKRFNRQTADIRYSLPSDETLENLIRHYIANGGMLAETDVFPNFNKPKTEPPANGWRQFGTRTSQNSDALHDEVKEHLAANSLYSPDTNGRQINRALEWVKAHATENDPGGYYAAAREVLAPDFNFASADGQARMLVLMSMAAKSGDVAMETMLADAYNKQGTGIGQALQARNVFRLMSPGGRESIIRKTEDDINKQYADKGKKTRVHLSEETIQAARDAQTEKEFNEVRKRANKELAEQMPSDWKDKLRGFRYFCMLFNPVTHIRNVLGNAGFMPAIAAKNKIGAITEKVSRVDQGERTKTLGLASKDARAFAKQDVLDMKDELTGEAKYNDMNPVERERKPFSGWLQKMLDFNSNALELEDWVFLQRHYRNALAGWMTANKVTGAQLQANPDLLAKARAYAVQEAQKATYRDASKFASMMSDISRKGGPAGFIVDAVLPFKKTPTNILKRGIEYSPIGLAKTLFVDSAKLIKYAKWANSGEDTKAPTGALSPTQYIDKLAAGLSGSAIAALGALLAGMGWLKVDLDDDDEIAKQNGEQAYALSIELFGQDISYTIDWLAPSSMPLFVGASIFNEAMRPHEAEDALDIAGHVVDAFLNISEPVFNLSMLDGVNSLLTTNNWSDTGNNLTDIFTTIVSNYVTSFAPTVLGKIAKTFFDTTRRETFIESGTSNSEAKIQRTWQKILAKVPGATHLLKPYVSPLGETEQMDLVPAIIQNFLSPGYFKTVDISEMEEEMQRLYEATGEKAVIPKQPAKYYQAGGEKFIPDAEQYTQLQLARGGIAKDLLEKVVASPEYQVYGDDARVKMVKDAWEFATQTAKQQLTPEAKMDKWVAEAQADPLKAINERREQEALTEAIAAHKTDLFKAIKDDDIASAMACIEGLKKDGKDKSYIKSAVTKEYKPQYLDAVRNGDDEAAASIMATLMSLKELGYERKTFKEWLEADMKKQKEDAEKDE